MSRRPYFVQRWTRDPQGDHVRDLAVGGGIWDGSGATFGACDLLRWPGWRMARFGWPGATLAFWPLSTDPVAVIDQRTIPKELAAADATSDGHKPTR